MQLIEKHKYRINSPQQHWQQCMHKAWDISRRMQFWKIGVARRPARALLLWSDLWAPKINHQLFTTSATLSWKTKFQNGLNQTPLLLHLLVAPFNEQSPFRFAMLPCSSSANCRCKPQEMIAIMWRQRTSTAGQEYQQRQRSAMASEKNEGSSREQSGHDDWLQFLVFGQFTSLAAPPQAVIVGGQLIISHILCLNNTQGKDP